MFAKRDDDQLLDGPQGGEAELYRAVTRQRIVQHHSVQIPRSPSVLARDLFGAVVILNDDGLAGPHRTGCDVDDRHFSESQRNTRLAPVHGIHERYQADNGN